MTQFIVFISLVFALVLWAMYRRHHRQVMQDRAALFNEAYKVLNIRQSVADRAGFRHVLGQFAGHSVALRLEIDNLTARKLPVMWLHITMLRPDDASGSLDILVRPNSSDVFSPGWNWGREVTPLKSWPQHARYVSRGQPPVLQTIDNDIRTIFADQRAKELLITPEAARLTYLIKQADRGHYLLLRTADFDMQPLDSAEIAALARQLQTLLVNLDGIHYEKAA